MNQATHLATSNGRIELIVRKGVAPIDIHTSNGSLTLKLHEYFGGKLDARTSNGSVECKFPILLEEIKRKHVIGLLNRQDDSKIVVRTTNGPIHLHKYE